MRSAILSHFVLFLKQTLASHTCCLLSFAFLFSPYFSSEMLPAIHDQTTVLEKGAKSVKCFIWRSSNWLTENAGIEKDTSRNKLCNWYHLSESSSSFIKCDCFDKITLFVSIQNESLYAIDFDRKNKKKKKYCRGVYKHFNALNHHITWWPVSIKVRAVQAINGVCMS